MVTVYYITYEQERDLLLASIEVMSSYKWVEWIVVIHTGKEKPNLRDYGISTKMVQHWQYCGGNGLHNESTFDEVQARNLGLNVAYSLGSEWILQCDSDEFFLPRSDFDLKMFDEYNAGLFETYNFFDAQSYRTQGIGTYKGLLDPHIRMWRSELKVYHTNPNRPDMLNPSFHTCFRPEYFNYKIVQDELAHIHIHDAVTSKYRPFERVGRAWNINWPAPYRKLIGA